MTKPIIVVKICYKLLYVIQVVKKIFDKYVSSWPQLISKFLVAPICNADSDWPRTFFTPKVFLISISLLFWKQILLLASSREVLHGRGVARGGHTWWGIWLTVTDLCPTIKIYLFKIYNVAIVKTTLATSVERSGISSVVTLVTSRVTKVR